MTEPTAPTPDRPDAGRKPSAEAFRWQAAFGRSTDPVFVLDRRRRLLYVNAAWEALTGIPSAEARLLVCRRLRPGDPDNPLQAVVKEALRPPHEVRQGATARMRRLLPGRRWWDVEFFPLRQQGEAAAVLILGRITAVAGVESAAAAPLPERLVALREQAARRYGPELLEGATPALRRLAEQVRLAQQTTAPVLLVGEPGVGKRTVARLIHYGGPSRERPLAVLDCARLPAGALADVLFGAGRTALGAIYLHEPSHLPRDLQLRVAELLRGGSEGAATPRFLAGCGADAAEEVRAGRLLDELYSSLAVLTLHLPPLRERTADLPLLANRLLERCNAEGEAHVKALAADAWDVVRDYAWPGNLRELYAVLSAARRHARGDRITAADLPASLRLLRRLEETPAAPPPAALPLDALLEEAERRLMELAIRRARGNKTRAADLLSIPRPRLWRRLKALGLIDSEAADGGEE